MDRDDLQDTTADQLASLLSCDTQERRVWTPEEMGAVLRHQLSLPPGADSRDGNADPNQGGPADTLAHAESTSDAAGAQCGTFADHWSLFASATPPLELLQAVKDSAKSAAQHADSPLPDEVATLVYFAAIAAALVYCGQRISRLDDTGLQWGFEWSLRQDWVPEQLRSLYEQARQKLLT
jgi:hypothetical protein